MFAALLSPIWVGKIELVNRLVVPPMATNLADENGYITDQFEEYYLARAKGEWGLIVMEFTAVDPLGKAGPRTPGLWDDTFIPRLLKFTRKMHEIGAKVFVQLAHAGRQTEQRIVGVSPVAPSPIPCPLWRETPKEMSTDEVWELIEKFAEAARRAKEAGFDGIEVHGAHGYLIGQFLSSWSNRRTDEFGGSLLNRAKLALEIIKAIRKAVGDNFPVTFRISIEEKVPDGMHIEETVSILRLLEGAGVNAFSISAGVAAAAHFIIAPSFTPRGYLLPYCERIKSSISVPCIAVGRIDDLYLAEEAVRLGKADLIALGRPSIADPEIPKKIRVGQVDAVRPCIYCLRGCLRTFPHRGKPLPRVGITCTVNPLCATVGTPNVIRKKDNKKVLVIGGGPAGLAAATTAASRGHAVILFEREEALGGKLRLASILPSNYPLSLLIRYYENLCKHYGIEVHLKTEVSASELASVSPDVIILATGADFTIPQWALNLHNTLTPMELLKGEKDPGEKVAIVGSTRIGCELAEFLAQQGRNVFLISHQAKVGANITPFVRTLLLERLRRYKVKFLTEAKITKSNKDRMGLFRKGKEIPLQMFQSVIFTTRQPDRKFQRVIKDFIGHDKVFVIGDALFPRSLLAAIREGTKVGLQV